MPDTKKENVAAPLVQGEESPASSAEATGQNGSIRARKHNTVDQ